MLRYSAIALLVVSVLNPALPADDGWITNRDGTSINRFDTDTNTEQAANSPFTVGTTPVDLAQNNAAGADPGRVYVVNNGSDDISVIDRGIWSLVQTIDGSTSVLGTLDSPSGIVRATNGTIAPTLAVVDSKVTSPGRSTIRFINPSNGVFVDEMRDNSPSALYVDVAFSPNGRFWITDAGDNGVTVLRMDGEIGPPFGKGLDLIFAGPGEFADFIFDGAGVPTFLIAPQRVAVSPDGNFVVVTDAGSANITVINANYVSEGAAIVATVDATTASATITETRDVTIVGDTAYITTDDIAAPVIHFDVSTATGATVPGVIAGIGMVMSGIGALPDGSKVYAGEDTGGGGMLVEIDPATNTVIGLAFALTGNTFPFGMLFTGPNKGAGSVDPGFGGSNNSQKGGHGGCHGGATSGGGLSFLILLLILGMSAVRRR